MLAYPPESAEVINLANTLRRMGNDRRLMREMAAFFIDDVPPLLEELRQALEAEDAATAARSAHSLKGLASNFDARQAVDVARQLEMAAGEERFAEGHRLLPVLQEEVDRVFAALNDQLLQAK